MSAPSVAVTGAKSARPGRIHLSRGGWVALGFLVLMVLTAIFGPLLVTQDPNTQDLLAAFSGPSADHLLGTDATGRDILARLVHGARPSLLGPALIVLLSLAISVPLALLAAWQGGWVSAGISRVVDVVFAIPGILLAILTVAVFGAGLTSAVAALAVAYVPFLARVIMSAAAAQCRMPYVEVLTIQGLSPRRIMTVHVLRNISPLLIGQTTVTFAYALIDLAALSFLGLGVQAPSSDWGVMVSDRDSILQGHPQQVAVASIAIVLTVLSLLVVGAQASGEDRRRLGRRWRRKP